jgi:hypothetical protein
MDLPEPQREIESENKKQRERAREKRRERVRERDSTEPRLAAAYRLRCTRRLLTGR